MLPKEELLRLLEIKVLNCKDCVLYEETKKKVMGEGASDSLIFFVGEAPGRKENESGRPFVGSAGKLLDKLLMGAGLSRELVFIGNVIKCRPPNNRRPMKNEISACSTFLENQLTIIQPKIIVPMGKSAMDYIFMKFGIEKKEINQTHGKLFKVETTWGEVLIFPLYHPAAAIYNRKLIVKLQSDMGSLKRLFECL